MPLKPHEMSIESPWNAVISVPQVDAELCRSEVLVEHNQAITAAERSRWSSGWWFFLVIF